MRATFGRDFSPHDLSGWRGEQFTEREDCFQQLIGDALLEVHGGDAHVSPTLGRDGSIDAWVEEPAAGCDLIGNLEGPVIIECKDHQAQTNWAATWKNVLTGWGKVRTKLQEQANAGFAGKFEPWRRAKSYVYCISVTIPDQQSKDELTAAISVLLRGIAPHIKDVIVYDWRSLSFWLNKQRRVADSWLGAGHPSITGHLEYINSLTGIRRYLLNEHLSYEAPDATSETHPAAIWRLLNDDNPDSRPGLVLHGPGGVGKTRLCLEVANRAHENGWRVLHISPTAESLTERELTAVIASDSRSTLLCLDYIDFMQGTEFLLGGIRLVRDAAGRGIRLRFLANSRPMWALAAIREAAALDTFSFRELRPTDEENDRLLHRMVASVAPNALSKWGYQAMLRACGRRPIIALFTAREVEYSFEKGRLSENEMAAVGGGELSVWLRKRLAQDELTIQEPNSLWKASEPSNEMVAACGALVTAPSTHQIAVDAASTVLRSLGSNTDPDLIARRLKEMGWLEQQGPWLTTPHDVVTDEVMDQVLRDGSLIRPGPFEALLSLWGCDPPAIGRVASALQRWIGAMQGQAAAENAKIASMMWLRSHASAIGPQLATGDSDRTGFALGAILRWPLWSEIAADCWDSLISPWITLHRKRREARHVFYVGLHRTSLANRLIDSALVWAEAWSQERGASYVLSSLLERAELQGDELRRAVRSALAWLGHYPLEKEAKFVINPLLERSDLEDEELDETIVFALAWLGHYPLEKDAKFVINSLLERSDLQGEELDETIAFALAWLDQHPSEKGTHIVIRRLLEGGERQGLSTGAIIGRALAWLAYHPLEKDASYVLHRLLERSELRGEEMEATITYGLTWLTQYQRDRDAEFVLSPLLERYDLRSEWSESAIKNALEWLSQHQEEKGSQFVVKRLLGRAELRDADLRTATGHALAWLAKYPEERDAMFVITALLKVPELEDSESQEAVRCAYAWLAKYGLEKDAEFILKPLLGRIKRVSPEAAPARGFALAWLTRYSAEPDSLFLLKPLLERVRLEEPELRKAVGCGLAWLAKHPLDRDAQFVLAPLLLKGEPQGAESAEVIKFALTWLAEYRLDEDAPFVIGPLLRRPELRGATLRGALRGAISWLRKYPSEKASILVLNRILRRKDTSDEDWLAAAEIGSDWLTGPLRDPTDKGAIVNSLLKRPAILPYATLQAAVDAKLERWLSAYADGQSGPTADFLYALEHLPQEDPLVRKVKAAMGRH